MPFTRLRNIGVHGISGCQTHVKSTRSSLTFTKNKWGIYTDTQIIPYLRQNCINLHKNYLKFKFLKTDFKPLIVIMITSMAESILQRQEVRRTWMQWTKRFRVQALFFLGLDEDAPNFQDIYSVNNTIH